ncbi:hypothetical protein RC74_14685 [Falsihalocynthiibacter arcticus]|uniref:Uncharacterized protein n=1 Tax=Falsihalocynthiibacter arcticus TaxID=1579316 RepID=A0A126V215_9RHOB|nr:hypothetical protein RC74_14685 [Falsihalocynthiibacter arcticus]
MIKEGNNAPARWFANDRILYNWQVYANRSNDKTIDRHLAVIRYCENKTQGKDFGSVTIEDLCKVRNDLKQCTVADAEGQLWWITARIPCGEQKSPRFTRKRATGAPFSSC